VTYLVDTNVLSELRKGPRANVGVRGWFASVDDDQLFLSVLVIGELRQGIEGKRRTDPTTANHLERWLRVTVQDYEGRILRVDEQIADLWGRLNVPDRLPPIDGLLAATALAHDLTVVTRDTRDIESTGVPTLNPFRK
jgi:predicted nucleic acid-binding protein